MSQSVTIEYDTVDELDRELRGLIETFYHTDDDEDSIPPGEAIETFLAVADELELALDERVIGGFFQRETARYVARAQGFNGTDADADADADAGATSPETETETDG